MTNLQMVVKETLQVITNNNERVLLTSQLAEQYGTDNKVISYNFNNNIERYEEGKHFYKFEGNKKNELLNHLEIHDGSRNAKTLYLWTERGALLHAKSLNTTQAWNMYDELVESYFKFKEVKNQFEGLSPALQQMIKLEVRQNEQEKVIGVIEGRLSHVENNERIDSHQQNIIMKAVNKRVCHVHTELNPNELERKLIFPKMHRDLRDSFFIPTYKDLKKIDFQDCLKWISNWRMRG